VIAPRHERLAQQILDLLIGRGDADEPRRLALVAARLAEWETTIEAQTRRPFEDLFAGGPDTSCRTVWDESEAIPALGIGPLECVSVPLDDLRAAFRAAGRKA
jgi:hypothetical protein